MTVRTRASPLTALRRCASRRCSAPTRSPPRPTATLDRGRGPARGWCRSACERRRAHGDPRPQACPERQDRCSRKARAARRDHACRETQRSELRGRPSAPSRPPAYVMRESNRQRPRRAAPRSELIVARQPEKRLREVSRCRHHAATGRPSESAEWIRLQRTGQVLATSDPRRLARVTRTGSPAPVEPPPRDDAQPPL
jgi:hypothetical protein